MILVIIASIVGLGGLIWLPKLYRWISGIKVNLSIMKSFEETQSDEIIAKVVNRSNESQYIIRCVAYSTYPASVVLFRHIKNPFLNPKQYKRIRYSSPSFDLLGNEKLKLEPFEPINLHYHFPKNHPFAKLVTPMIQVEVEISNGRIFRSSKLTVPENWML